MTPQIFISYARDDDAAPPDARDAKGFVTYLHEQLAYELKQLGPPAPVLWRDRKAIERGRQFEPELEDQVRRSHLIIVVLSGNWLAREWCRKEVALFEAAHRHGDKRDLRERIICVGKHHILPSSRPELLQGQEGFNLYGIDPLNGEQIDYFDRGKVLNEDYFKIVKELARYAHRRLGATGGSGPEPPPPPPPSSPTGRAVFVAWPASDMELAYQGIVKELTARNFAVVPPPLPRHERLGTIATRGEAEARVASSFARQTGPDSSFTSCAPFGTESTRGPSIRSKSRSTAMPCVRKLLASRSVLRSTPPPAKSRSRNASRVMVPPRSEPVSVIACPSGFGWDASLSAATSASAVYAKCDTCARPIPTVSAISQSC